MKAILWDLGNVLVRFQNRNEVCRKIARNFGCDDLPALFEGVGEGAFLALDVGEISHEELWQHVCKKGDIHPSKMPLSIFSALYVTHLHPILEQIALARELQDQALMFAVSNGDFGSEYVARLLACDHGIAFKEAFISRDFGIKKPLLLAKVAEVLRRAHNLETHDCVFVDDIPEYVHAATALGIHGLLHNATVEPEERLREQFRGLNFRC